MTTSENIEMYLVSIAIHAEENPKKPVPLSRLAEDLQVLPVSVNQMVRKLEKEDLLNYFPYKGVELTKKGNLQAKQLLRHRRLWEVFFVNYLNFSPNEANILACRIEHISTPEVSDRLSNFLNDPLFSTLGKKIPNGDGGSKPAKHIPLFDLHAGDGAEIIQLTADKISNDYLSTQGIKPGTIINILAMGSDGNMLVKISDKTINLSSDLSQKIYVQKS